VTRRAPPTERKARGSAAFLPHHRLLVCAALGGVAGIFWPDVETCCRAL
jgi:hypothetical protein